MNLVRRAKPQTWISAWVLITVLLYIFYPLIRPGFPITDDGDWMIIRLSAFYQSLADRQVPVRVLGRLNNAYGYPVANFLYPGYLYIGALLHLIGFGFTTSVKILITGAVSGTAVLFYAYLRRFFQTAASFMGTLTFLTSPYLLFDIYKRGSVGEILAFLPAAGALYGIEAGKGLMLVFSTALLVVSHNTIGLLFLIMITGYIIVTGRNHFLMNILLGLGLTTFFWLPAIWELRFVSFRSLSLSQPDEFYAGKIPWLFGFIPVFIAATGLILRKKILSVRDMFYIWILFVSGFLAFPVSSILWKSELLIQFVQFPFRFLALFIIGGSYTVATFIDKAGKRWVWALLFISIWIPALYWALSSVRPGDKSDSYYATNEATTTVANEYLPIWTSVVPTGHPHDKVIVHSGRGIINVRTSNSKRIEAHLSLQENSDIQINMIYYPGWGVLVDNEPVQVRYDNPMGVMRISVPSGEHELAAELRETMLRLFADFISLVSLLVIGWIFARNSFAAQSVKK